MGTALNFFFGSPVTVPRNIGRSILWEHSIAALSCQETPSQLGCILTSLSYLWSLLGLLYIYIYIYVCVCVFYGLYRPCCIQYGRGRPHVCSVNLSLQLTICVTACDEVCIRSLTLGPLSMSKTQILITDLWIYIWYTCIYMLYGVCKALLRFIYVLQGRSSQDPNTWFPPREADRICHLASALGSRGL